MQRRLPLQRGRGGAGSGTIMTQTNGIQGEPEIGNGHGHIREPGTAIGGGSTRGVDGDIARDQTHQAVNMNEIAATRVATSGRRQKNGTRTRTLAVPSVADESTGDTRAETTRRTTNVDGGRVAHQILSKTYLTNAAALHRFQKTEVYKEKSQLKIARYATYLHPRGPHRRLLKTMQWTLTPSLAAHRRARKEIQMMSHCRSAHHHEYAHYRLRLRLLPAVHVVVPRRPRPFAPLRSHHRHFLPPLSRPKWTNTSRIRTTLVSTLPPYQSLLYPKQDLSMTQNTRPGTLCSNFYANAERTKKRRRG